MFETVVRKGGVLILTKAMIDRLGEDVTHLQAGYNEKTRAIGIRRAGEDARGRYRHRSQRNSQSGLIDGKRLFAHHGLTATKARTFEVEEFGEGIIVFTMTAEPEAEKAEPKKTDVKGRKSGGRAKAA